MLNLPVLIYCASGNKRYMDIALKYGFKCGAQLPGTIYHDLYFADLHPDTPPPMDKYMALLDKHRPYMATVMDYQEGRSFEDVMQWAECASRFVQEVIIIPKIFNTIPDIPHEINGKKVRLGYSVPTSHGGTEVPIWEFGSRPVHLLGGSPQAQLKNMRYLNVKSADGNMIQKMANQRAQFFGNGAAVHTRSRYFPQLQEVGLIDIPIDRNYMAFELSCINFLAALRGCTCTIRYAIEADIPYIVKIARQYSKELGFVRTVSLKEAIVKRELYVAEYGRQIVGFCNWHKRRDGVHVIYEIAVDKARLGEKIGVGLLWAVPNPLRLKCTVDNDRANGFYASQGMQLVEVEQGRKRQLNVWELMDK